MTGMYICEKKVNHYVCKMFGSEPNVQVRSDPEPEPPFRFVFDGLVEPNPEHNVRFGFEHCL
jgi:hypothetical protein